MMGSQQESHSAEKYTTLLITTLAFHDGGSFNLGNLGQEGSREQGGRGMYLFDSS